MGFSLQCSLLSKLNFFKTPASDNNAISTWSYEGLVQLLWVVGGDDQHPPLHLHHTVQHFQQVRQGQLSVGDKKFNSRSSSYSWTDSLFKELGHYRWIELTQLRLTCTERSRPTLQRNFTLCIPKKGTARPLSQFPHSWFCGRSIYSHNRPTYFPAAEADRSEEYINRSQKHECRSWDCSRAIPFLGIFVSNFPYCVFAV